ncbi:hypothetical protein MJO28_006605 [Puccinia striiformis f. sp. tritici]|uniref:Uncharacterized protein n=1 Tax=Puccinia striiformis f. sp. tritici TaxID=168172 RepID=A0ACC0EJR6_9BASI|nr:hypothetical protein MJO28_006605 [Puccinia striiformis f. sp. tritici]
MTHSRSPDPGHKTVPAHHPSLKGKAIAQIRTILSKLDEPVSVPTKIKIEALRILATEKLNAAEVTELSPSASEDGDVGSGKQTPARTNNSTANCARAVQIPASHQPTAVRPASGNIGPEKCTLPGASTARRQPPTGSSALSNAGPAKRGSPASNNTGPEKLLNNTGPEKCSSPALSNVGPEKRASPASSNTGAEKHTLSAALTACHQTPTGPDHNAATPALSKTGTPEHTGAVKPPCQIPAAALRPEAWALVDGPSDTTLPPVIQLPHIANVPILVSLSGQFVSESLTPLKPQDQPPTLPTPPLPSSSIIPPSPDRVLTKRLSTPNPTYLNQTTCGFYQPLDVYNIPISLPVLSFTSVTPQKPCIVVSADKPTSTPNQEFCQPHNNAGFVPMDLDVAEVPVDTDVVESPVEDLDIAKSPVEDIDVVKSPIEDTAKELKPHLTKTAEEPKPHSTENPFQCLADDIEQAKLRLKIPAPITVKPYPTNSIPLPHLDAVLETSTAADSLPRSSTFDF